MPAANNRDLSRLREAIRAATHMDEVACVTELARAGETILDTSQRQAVLQRAGAVVMRCREQSDEAGTLDAFLQQFGLSSDEGVALMCLAEALLRVPDEDTADQLIAEKIRSGDWQAHLGQSSSGLVNASVWGLMLTGQLVTLDPKLLEDSGAWMRRLLSRLGEPVVRTAAAQAMRILGSQFVLGRDVDAALNRGRDLNEPGDRFSFDMLGEGARTLADAERYFDAYRNAIDHIGTENRLDPVVANGISVKLSALHPRFEYAQAATVRKSILPRLKALALHASQRGLGFNIDAEEAARLELTLELFEALAQDPDLAGWSGLGFVLQAYQKRAPLVADWLIALGRITSRRFMVRLVKGAYWDTEVKHAQVEGFDDYPVFTSKANTDLCYEVCAARLLAADDVIFPQFATHNAHTASVILELAGGHHAFEFQRLHGMGQLLYRQLNEETGKEQPVRVYAPVGSHQDLLPYLVRRLLENGANSSFVNRFLDAELPIDELLSDALESVRSQGYARHPRIPLPKELYTNAGQHRLNSSGIDLDDPTSVESLLAATRQAASATFFARPIVNGEIRTGAGDESTTIITNPADRRQQVGQMVAATSADIEQALSFATASQPAWDLIGGAARAERLERAAELFEINRPTLMGLIIAEAGRTVADALSEVREAVDFCRYYAWQARTQFEAPEILPGPTGEQNELSLHGRGVFACISPWNFPLAIFVGQTSAALAAGNSVIAKPAEQTPLIAAQAIRLLHQAGVPADVLHLLPGSGAEVGGALVADPRVAGIAFTGSTAVARIINQQLAQRDGPIATLIAETGGQNVMLVDSTALIEQVADDVIASAFKSAGQRCSGLRVLYLQEDIAEKTLTMLKGAMATLVIGNPLMLDTDVGPVIDEQARERLQRHVTELEATARPIAECPLPSDCGVGSFFAPQVFEIDSIRQLDEEVFGPILHVVRFDPEKLDAVIEDINATGYGLTLGVHSRIDGFARQVFESTRVGNTYINRNMVGAVVGVQPFGGEGLSGTGPKAGGPNYLKRFATERTRTENVAAKGGNIELFGLLDSAKPTSVDDH